ncbi:MAG: 2TM domain-containing protein [Candidatus Helarchaeota archaeon]|nr:2TM domain-containing protein [Candidatus Helarchaeota archaeon]
MSEDIEISEESLRRIAEQKVSFRYSVKIHTISYILINIVLIAYNAISTPNISLLSNWWAIYPALGWLVGLVIHASAYGLYVRGTNDATSGIVIHLVAYSFTILFLVVIDLISNAILDWAFYPAMFWALGIIGHLIVSLWVTREKSPEVKEVKQKISRMDRAIEKEMKKMREKTKNK